MPTKTPVALVKQMLAILHNDREEILLRIDDYMHGHQDMPYTPENADPEYKLLAKRAVTNVMPFITSTPAQQMYVDAFRPGRPTGSETDDEPGARTEAQSLASTPEWEHWQQSGMDARQSAIYMGSFAFGHSFVVTEKVKNVTKSRGLSALRSSALYLDPANDLDPYAALTITAFPKSGAGDDETPGSGFMWDDQYKYAFTFKSFLDLKEGVQVFKGVKHGAKECPVTRFACTVDLEGRTHGVVAPMIELQNRINQTVFDLLIVQSFASFKVRTVSGMSPPIKMKPTYEAGVLTGWEPEINPHTGMPIPDEVIVNAKRIFWAEDPDTKFGTLDETPLDGFISAIELAFRHMAALSQTPPHHILGQIANLSAEALEAAETALTRKVAQFQGNFGEAWERVFRVAAQIGGYEGEDDYSGEVIWRDMEGKSLAQSADALGKLHDQLGVPRRGLWARVPGVTATELQHWEELAKEEDFEQQVADSLQRAGSIDPATSEAEAANDLSRDQAA